MLCLQAAAGFGQDEADDPDRVSNDQPGRPLQMPPASSEVKEAFDDFARFGRRGAWERALKALDAIPDDQNARFVDGEDGFFIRVELKRRSLLAGLPPEGQAAYRLFYDTEAERLFADAEGDGEQETLERLFTSYFLSSVGDDAADRLGDLYFEQGRFDRAADCWLAILRDHPESDLPPGLVSVKAALALHRAGRRSECEELRREIARFHAAEDVSVAGEAVSAEELVGRLIEAEADPEGSAGNGEEPPVLADRERAAWQVRFGESVVAGMTPQEREQWEKNAFSAVVPAVAIEADRLFANYLGHIFAVDLTTGKMLWRSAAFHHVEVPASQNQGRAIDPSRYAIVASGDLVWSLERDIRDQNYQAPFRLVCRRADLGDLTWQSTDLPDYADVDLVGPPLLADGRMFIAAKSMGNQQSQQRAPAQSVLAIRPRDGKILWRAEAGTLRQDQRYSYYGMATTDPQPRLLYRAGAIYVDTHAGVLARLDAADGEVDWGYGYATEPAQAGRGFFIRYDEVPEPRSDSSPPVEAGGAIVVKGAKSDRIAGIDPDRMARLWDRPIARSSRLLGMIGGSVILGGPEVDAMEVDSRSLLWSIRLPGGSGSGRPIVRPDGLWHLTPRGIFELDPGSGRVRRIVRGDDTGSAGGDLFLTDRLLVAVSNRTISAYDRSPIDRQESRTIEGGESDD